MPRDIAVANSVGIDTSRERRSLSLKGDIKGAPSSHIEEIVLPDGVTGLASGNTLSLKGPKGEASRKFAAPKANEK